MSVAAWPVLWVQHNRRRWRTSRPHRPFCTHNSSRVTIAAAAQHPRIALEAEAASAAAAAAAMVASVTCTAVSAVTVLRAVMHLSLLRASDAVYAATIPAAVTVALDYRYRPVSFCIVHVRPVRLCLVTTGLLLLLYNIQTYGIVVCSTS